MESIELKNLHALFKFMNRFEIGFLASSKDKIGGNYVSDNRLHRANSIFLKFGKKVGLGEKLKINHSQTGGIHPAIYNADVIQENFEEFVNWIKKTYRRKNKTEKSIKFYR